MPKNKKVQEEVEAESPEEETPAPKKGKAAKKEEPKKSAKPAKPVKKAESEDEDEEDATPAPKKAAAKPAAPKKAAAAAPKKAAKPAKEESEDEEEEEAKPVKQAKPAKKAKEVSEEEEDEEPVKKSAAGKSVGVTVYLKGLAFAATEDDVTAFFAEVGTPTLAIEKGRGTATFATEEEADAAVALSGGEVAGRTLYVHKTDGRDPTNGGTKFSVFIGNVDRETGTEEGIKEFLEECGEIQTVRLLTDRETGESKGCAFVDFSTKEAADAAIAKNGETLFGREVKINEAANKPQKSFGGGNFGGGNFGGGNFRGGNRGGNFRGGRGRGGDRGRGGRGGRGGGRGRPY